MSVTITLPADMADALKKALKTATTPKTKSAATVKVRAGAGAGAADCFKITIFKKEIKDTANRLLAENGMEFPEDDEKASKKIYDGFKAFVNENTFENIEEACAAFPKFWSEKKEPVAKKTPAPKKAGKKPVDKPVETKDEIEFLSIEDLQAIEELDETDTPGIYWDVTNGRKVGGPPAEDDEEVKDMKFEGQVYAVAQTTYRVSQGASKDSFKGYAGVGKFKDMC